MTESTVTPLPRWERLAVASARVGIPPDLLRSHIDAGRAHIRTAVLGRRGLVHVAADDVDAFARGLATHPAASIT